MDRFERAQTLLAVHEGGYSNHPKDPGGATMKGVTQRTYDSYRRANGMGHRPVKNITDEEVFAIYRGQYWNAINGDQLPSGVAYCVFDAAVNSGPSRAAKWLQIVVGASVDGVVGNETVSLTRAYDPEKLIDEYCDKRLAFMKRLKHWSTFKNGWTRRVAEVRAQSKAWARGNDVDVSDVPPQPKADGPDKIITTVKDAMKNPGAIGTVTGIIGSTGALASGDGPVQYAVAVVLVVAAVVAIWWIVRDKR